MSSRSWSGCFSGISSGPKLSGSTSHSPGQVDHLRAYLRWRLGEWRAFDLGIDDLLQRGLVFVLVALGVEAIAEIFDQGDGHLQFFG